MNSTQAIHRPIGALALAAMMLAGAAPAQAVTVVDIDVTGILSHDEYGQPGNTVLTVQLDPYAHITGIGWSVSLTAFSPSWLEEISVAFEDSTQSQGVVLRPGTGDQLPGSGSYSSGGIVDIVGSYDFFVGADGVLRLEFFEDWSDGLLPDGQWDSGTLSIQAVPEPATWGMAALGLLAIGAAAGRRRPR